MFTGIVEATAQVVKIVADRTNIHFTMQTSIAAELKVDQSVSHDGVCLTTVFVDPVLQQYTVTALQETLDKTNMRTWKEGYRVNLERCVKIDGRLDGHIVQGHVDQTAVCTKVEELDGSWKFWFEYDRGQKNITVEKGSISVNGVSLTVVDSEPGIFSVAIIPYTFENTNFGDFRVGTVVNLEFDILGKYVARLLEQYFEARK